MVNRRDILSRVDSMSPEELSRILRETLEASGIEYYEASGHIDFNSFLPRTWEHRIAEARFVSSAITSTSRTIRSYKNDSCISEGNAVSVSKDTFYLYQKYKSPVAGGAA